MPALWVIASAMFIALSVIVAVVCVVLLAGSMRRERQARAQAARSEEESDRLRQELTKKSGEVAQALAQASAEMEELRRVAEHEAEAARAAAANEAQAVRAEAEAARAAASEEAAALRAETEQMRGALQAIRNVIDGYGDRYIVPVESLLDELAADFGFDEAGKRLKAARAETNRLVQAQQAAACDYVEASRKETAIDFVLDAFNGKVDSILSRTKADNVGVLEQKIIDAFHIVNHHGRAFRNARIEKAYLDARIEELRWGCIVAALRDRDREEQRAIRERIREEERAQREFEKAQKEAAKQEKAIRDAIAAAQQQFAKANEADKAKLESDLAELAEKLRIAEEKGQRAMSMAQQTKAGHVYVISNEGSFGENIYKIGVTRRLEPLDRIRELGDASVPFSFDVHALIRSDDAPALEHDLHKKFARHQVNKVNPRKEFFEVKLADVRAAIEQAGYSAQWTMAAACAEYKESLAIAERLRSGAIDERAWTERQVAEHDAAMRVAIPDESGAGVA